MYKHIYLQDRRRELLWQLTFHGLHFSGICMLYTKMQQKNPKDNESFHLSEISFLNFPLICAVCAPVISAIYAIYSLSYLSYIHICVLCIRKQGTFV